MSASITRSFAEFSKKELQSAVATVNARRKRGLFLSIGAGAGVFLVLVATVYLFFAPYSELMGKHGISYWPLLLLAPASLALIAFSLVYILTLRSAVREFRESLVGKIAEYIDPALVHESEKKLPAAELEGELLAAVGGAPVSGTDQFRGRVPGAVVHFSEIRVKREKGGADGKGEVFSGLYFHAAMERSFAMPVMVFPSSVELSRSAFEEKFRAAGYAVGSGLLRLDDPASGRQILVPSGGEEFVLSLLSSPAYARLDELRRSTGGSLSLFCRGDRLAVALLAGAARPDLPGMFDEFDFARCGQFCRAARLCLDMTLGMAARSDLWRDEKAATSQ